MEIAIINDNNQKIDEQFRMFYTDIKNSLMRCKYHKTLRDIIKHSNIFKDVRLYSMQLKILKLECIIKILKKKIKYFVGSINDYKNKIELYFINFDYELHLLQEQFKILIENQEIIHLSYKKKFFHFKKEGKTQNTANIQITHNKTKMTLESINKYRKSLFQGIFSQIKEDAFRLCIERYLLQADICFKLRQMNDGIAYLALSLRIAKVLEHDFAHIRTRLQISELYSMISSYLIIDYDYDNAQENLNCSLSNCLEYFKKISDQKETSNKSLIDFYLYKGIELVVKNFYLKGIINEDNNRVDLAVKNYLHSKWFCEKTSRCDKSNYELISRVENTACIILDWHKERKSRIKNNENNIGKNQQLSNSCHKNLNTCHNPDEVEKSKEMLKIKNLIDNCKYPFEEFELRIFHSKSNSLMLNTFRLTDYLLQQRNSQLLKNLEIPNINNLAKNDQIKIIKTLAVDEFQNKNQMKLNLKQNVVKNICFPIKADKTRNLKDDIFSTNLFKYSTSIDMKEIMKSTESSKKHKVTPAKYGSYGKEIKKMIYDDFIFSKKYHRNKKIIDSFHSRELNFQKQILKIKNTHTKSCENFDSIKEQQKAKDFYISKMSSIDMYNKSIDLNKFDYHSRSQTKHLNEKGYKDSNNYSGLSQMHSYELSKIRNKTANDYAINQSTRFNNTDLYTDSNNINSLLINNISKELQILEQIKNKLKINKY